MSPSARALIAIATLVVLLGAAGCSDDDAAPPPGPPTSSAATSGTDASSTSTAAPTSAPVPTSSVPSQRAFTTADGLPSDRVLGVDTNEDGTTWVAVGRDEIDVTVARLEGERWQTYDPPSRFFGRPALTAGPEGTAWLISDGFMDAVGLWEYDGAAWIIHLDCTPQGVAAGRCQRGANEAQGAAAGGDGDLWAHGFGTEGESAGCRFMRREADSWLAYPADPLERDELFTGFCPGDDFAPDGHPHALIEEGLFRLDRDGWTRLADAPGTAEYRDLVLVRWAVGPNGTVWTIRADQNALTLVWERFDGEQWTTVPIGPEGLANVDIDQACVLAEDPARDPAELETQLADPLGRANFLNGNLLPLAVDADGGVWTAIRCSGLIRTGPDGEVTHTLTTADGLPSLRIMDLDIDPSGALWVATMDGLVRLLPD